MDLRSAASSRRRLEAAAAAARNLDPPILKILIRFLMM
jgi:hypothetical protein